MVKLDGPTGQWTVGEETPLTEVSGLDAGSQPGWFIPRVGAAAAEPVADGRARIRSGLSARVLRPVTAGADASAATTYLERLAARSAAVRNGAVPRHRPRPGVAAARVPARRRGPRAVLAAPRRRRRPPRRRGQAQPRVLRGVRVGGARGAGARPGRRSRRTCPVVIDAKRGDIGSTAARQAVALYDVLGADAITVSPYLGEEAIAPLLARGDRLAYVLCRTSNPGAPELQSLVVADDEPAGAPPEPLYLRVARRVAAWGPGGTVGLVVGATAPVELAAIRDVAPGLPFLVPGVGAQGGEIDPVLADGPARDGSGRWSPGWRAPRQRHPRDRVRGGRPEHGRRGREGPRPGRRRLGEATPCATLAAARGPIRRRPPEPPFRADIAPDGASSRCHCRPASNGSSSSSSRC